MDFKTLLVLLVYEVRSFTTAIEFDLRRADNFLLLTITLFISIADLKIRSFQQLFFIYKVMTFLFRNLMIVILRRLFLRRIILSFINFFFIVLIIIAIFLR